MSVTWNDLKLPFYNFLLTKHKTTFRNVFSIWRKVSGSFQILPFFTQIENRSTTSTVSFKTTQHEVRTFHLLLFNGFILRGSHFSLGGVLIVSVSFFSPERRNVLPPCWWQISCVGRTYIVYPTATLSRSRSLLWGGYTHSQRCRIYQHSNM